MEETKKTLDCWAIVELMGHQRIAGRVTEKNVAGTQMLQVDVPEIGDMPAFSRFLGGSAIYAINPCDEETAKAWAASISSSSSPIISFDGRQLVNKLVEKRMAALPAGGAVEGQSPKCVECGRTISAEEFTDHDGCCANCFEPEEYETL